MSAKPIALQLYSVRDALDADFEGTLRRVAAMGFDGVEFAGNTGESPAQAAALLRALGLRAPAMHVGMPFGPAAFEAAAALGAGTLVVPWLPPERFHTPTGVEGVLADVQAAYEAARAHGLKLAYHNHDFEFRALADGSLPYDHLRRGLAPEVGFEVDIYWVRHAGGDPAALLRELGPRVPLLHVKDGTGVPGAPFLAAGEGIVDIPVALAAAQAEWLIVELDSCATDMFEAVEKSLRYVRAL